MDSKEQAERRTQFQESAEKIKAHERIIEQMQSSASTLQASPAKKKRRLEGKQSEPKNDFNPDSKLLLVSCEAGRQATAQSCDAI